MPTHSDSKILPYDAGQMFDLVADVAKYPEFLPWCAAARVRSVTPIEGGEEMLADLVISFQVFRERFGSRVRLYRADGRIETEYLDGPFRYLRSTWEFIPEGEGACEVRFFVDFEFRNFILQKAIGLVFDQAMRRIVRAFEERAQALYG